jgi:hypothetical protein
MKTFFLSLTSSHLPLSVFAHLFLLLLLSYIHYLPLFFTPFKHTNISSSYTKVFHLSKLSVAVTNTTSNEWESSTQKKEEACGDGLVRSNMSAFALWK